MKKKILIVEDETPLLRIIDKKLKTCGFDTFTAQSVTEAMQVLEKEKLMDAIWLDHYLLGSQSGFDLVVNLKSMKNGWEKIPIFIVSNTASQQNIQSYIELKVDKYYIKASTSLNRIAKDIIEHLGMSPDCVK